MAGLRSVRLVEEEADVVALDIGQRIVTIDTRRHRWKICSNSKGGRGDQMARHRWKAAVYFDEQMPAVGENGQPKLA